MWRAFAEFAARKSDSSAANGEAHGEREAVVGAPVQSVCDGQGLPLLGPAQKVGDAGRSPPALRRPRPQINDHLKGVIQRVVVAGDFPLGNVLSQPPKESSMYRHR